jgi:hypothetical protein
VGAVLFEVFDNGSESSDDTTKHPPAPLGVTGAGKERHRLRCNREQTEDG